MTDPEFQPDESIALGLTWQDTDQAARPANTFASALGLPAEDGRPDAVYLSIGHAEPPFLSGTPAEMEEQLRNMGSLPVKTLGRYVLSRARLQELVGVLQQAMEKFDASGGGERR
ncbi:hypothetical protein [[Kitasatospora] papulosa]|uniref:hypothetical protein n=1 Tax=[Kitasatospora] papulosa TaxID=1464011 RepID=UPI00362D8EE9